MGASQFLYGARSVASQLLAWARVKYLYGARSIASQMLVWARFKICMVQSNGPVKCYLGEGGPGLDGLGQHVQSQRHLAGERVARLGGL